MKLTFLQRLQRSKDHKRKNEYELKKFLIRDGKKHPVAIICPGGGYASVCSFLEGRPYAKLLNKMGYAAIVVYYRVGEKAHFPAPQEDLARAVQEAIDHAEEWNIDMKNYSVWGSSAGGHLAASFGTESLGYKRYGLPKPAAIILTYPVITMGEKTHQGTRGNLLGKQADEELIRMYSVERQVTQDYPPTYIWCGDADQTVDPDNSRMLESALVDKGVRCQKREFTGVGHAVGVGKGTAAFGWLAEAVAFWKECKNEKGN